VRPGVDVKLLAEEQELYVLAPAARNACTRNAAMRRRKLKWLWARLKQLSVMELGARSVAHEARRRARPRRRLHGASSMSRWRRTAPPFSYALNRSKLRQVDGAKARYLLRSNLCDHPAAQLWQFYIQLVEIEAAFRNLKDDLQLRPIFHQLERRIEATSSQPSWPTACTSRSRTSCDSSPAALTPRAVLDKLADIKMLDVHFPTTDGRTLILTRHTDPTPITRSSSTKLMLQLPPSAAATHHCGATNQPHPSARPVVKTFSPS